MFQKELELYDEVIAKHFEEYQRKMKNFCFLNGLDYDEDTLQDTYLKVRDIISRKGIKDKTEQGILNYFFLAFRNNLYQTHLQNSKKLIDKNADVFQCIIEDEDTIEQDEQRAQFLEDVKRYIINEVKNNFDYISYSIFRLRYLFTINGKQPTFKEIKRITGVQDTRKRLLEVTQWIKTNISKDKINELKNKDL